MEGIGEDADPAETSEKSSSEGGRGGERGHRVPPAQARKSLGDINQHQQQHDSKHQLASSGSAKSKRNRNTAVGESAATGGASTHVAAAVGGAGGDDKTENVMRAYLKRCGVILAEFPQLSKYFKKASRSASGHCVHECGQCSYSTLNKTTLMYHVVGVHLTLTPFLCTQGCGVASGSYNNLRQHESRVHGIQYEKKNSTSPSLSNSGGVGVDGKVPDFYMCSGCKKRFEAPLDLLRHYFGSHMDWDSWKLDGIGGGLGESNDGDDDGDDREDGERKRRRRVKELMSIDRLLVPNN